jgi:NADH dehydrogenase/NADH:ubiquinone oxidoreductase subunit G
LLSKVAANDYLFIASSKITLLRLCKFCGLTDFKFCYHEYLPIAGNCRICLIEIEDIDKQIAACVSNVESNLRIWTNNIFSKKARENVIEKLLINHPLDCPICDQGGDCDLQDQVKTVGGFISRFFFNKRSVKDKKTGFYIKTIMTRCIHCLRCVRFNNLLGKRSFGVLNRSNSSEIVYHFSKVSDFSGVTIDLCPVGALTAKNSAFTNRPWELKIFETVDILDNFGSNIYVAYKDFDILKIFPKSNVYINGNAISDNIRFSFDSNFNNRLKFIYSINKINNSYAAIGWDNFFPKVNSYFTNNKNLFLINNSLNLNTLLLLKKICYINANKIKLYSINASHNENLYIKNNGNISNLEKFNDICFLLFFNPEKTNPLIFLKLRLYNKNKFFEIIKSKSYFINQFLTTKDVLKFFTGKLENFSKKLLHSFKPLIIFGENFQKRFQNFNILYIQKKINFKYIINTLGSNSEAIKLLNILTFSKLKQKNSLYLVNLGDSLNIRKVLNKKQIQNSICFTTHKLNDFFKFKFIIPISTFLEEENLLINFEHRIQKTQKFNNDTFYMKSFLTLLKTFFYTNKYFIKFLYLKFFYELIKLPNSFITNFNLFNNINNVYGNYKNLIIFNSIKFASPLQNSNTWLKNSLSIRQNSHLQKKKLTNFIPNKVLN